MVDNCFNQLPVRSTLRWEIRASLLGELDLCAPCDRIARASKTGPHRRSRLRKLDAVRRRRTSISDRDDGFPDEPGHDGEDLSARAV